MSDLSRAYIFHEQKLLVNEKFQLPLIETLDTDLRLSENAVARDLSSQSSLLEIYQLVSVRTLITQWSIQQFEEASRAIQLLEWQRNHRYCSKCGHATVRHHSEFCMTCPSCHYRQYPRIQPCIITVITKGTDEVLLAKSIHRKDNVYGLIAGFVEVGETLEQAVARETKEEVGVNLKNIRYLSSQPWPFPSNLMLAFSAEYDGGEISIQEEEVKDAQFFNLHQLPEIPHEGSVAYNMIMHIKNGTPL